LTIPGAAAVAGNGMFRGTDQLVRYLDSCTDAWCRNTMTTARETITCRNLSHEVLDRLVAAIQRNDFPPGAKLPSERGLMTRYGVGRPAIREARFTRC